MAEEWGKIIIKADTEISKSFKEADANGFDNALKQLALYSNVDLEPLKDQRTLENLTRVALPYSIQTSEK